MGIVWQVVEDDALMPTVEAMAERLAAQPTRAFALTKSALHNSLNHDLTQQLALEADLQSQAGQTADFREGVTAFIEKRKPRFVGR